MWLHHTKGHIKTVNGYYKGNIPRWIFVSITVLFSIDITNQILKKQGAGYDVKEINKFRQLFYVDNLKLFYRDETEL